MFQSKKCYVCGTDSRQPETGIRELGNPGDLDLRPDGSSRSAIYMWIQRCIQCGYCSIDLSTGSDSAREIVNTQRYQMQLNDASLPAMANAYLCWSLLLQHERHTAEAARAALYATWICDDDSEYRNRSSVLRRETVALIQQANRQGTGVGWAGFSDDALVIDLLRRAGELQQAGQLCAEALEKELDERTHALLLFLDELIEDGDVFRHTIHEALEGID
jgi:hypothetical protein